MLRPTLGLIVVMTVAVNALAQSEHYPLVSHAEPPPYPPLARALNLTGTVELQLVIEKGIVSDASVKSVVIDCRNCTGAHTEEGERRVSLFLAAPSLANIKTWRFQADADRTTFVVRYVYRIAGKETAELMKPDVKVHLPVVTVTARPVKSSALP